MRRWGPLAVALGLLVHVGLGLLVRSGGPLGIDEAAFDVVRPLRTDEGLDVVRVLTDVGYFPAAVVATALLFVLVRYTKDLWDRPRPELMLGPAGGLSYPSGHSAYATAWVAAAIVTGRRPLIVAATVVVVAVMVSRLYLGVHFLTDVLGGAALGAIVYGTVLRK